MNLCREIDVFEKIISPFSQKMVLLEFLFLSHSKTQYDWETNTLNSFFITTNTQIRLASNVFWYREGLENT